MKIKGRLLQSLSESTPNPEVFPILPIVELAGSRRVLVENHLGVTEYSTEKIGIKMKYGELNVCGCKLQLEHMTRVKLIITGQIDCISLSRRNEK